MRPLTESKTKFLAGRQGKSSNYHNLALYVYQLMEVRGWAMEGAHD
jgi:hypothetical protein